MNPLHNPLLITAFVLLWIYGLCYLLARRSLRKTEIISKQTSGATNVVGVWNVYFREAPAGGWPRWIVYVAILSLVLAACILTRWTLSRPVGTRMQKVSVLRIF